MALQETLEKQGNWLFKYRGKLPLLLLALVIALFIRTEIYPETFILEETPYEVYYERLCLLVCLFGLAIRAYTVGHTPANTSGRNENAQLADHLNTTGIYSLVRHPLYLGNFFMWFGLAMMTGHIWFLAGFCVFYWIYYERIMFAEEQFLRKKFGSAYLEWAEKTPAFIPSLNFKKFRNPAYPFCLKKVLRQEKDGLVAIAVLFALFNLIGEAVEKELDFTLLVGATLVGVIYLILKYLKKYTRILNQEGR